MLKAGCSNFGLSRDLAIYPLGQDQEWAARGQDPCPVYIDPRYYTALDPRICYSNLGRTFALLLTGPRVFTFLPRPSFCPKNMCLILFILLVQRRPAMQQQFFVRRFSSSIFSHAEYVYQAGVTRIKILVSYSCEKI